MIQEEKELLLRDLCARLPYGIIVQQSAKYPKGHFMYNVADKQEKEPHDFKIIGIEGTNTLITDKRKEERTYAKGIISSPITICIHNEFTGQEIKPYLRPISAMTEKECDDLFKILAINEEEGEYIKINDIGILRLFCVTGKDFEDLDKALKYCDKHFIDYRGLISKELAVEAPENMYKF